MKRFLALFLISTFIFTGCNSEGEAEGEASEAGEASENSDGEASEKDITAGHEGEVSSEEDSAEEAYNLFFDCYNATELADSVTKEKEVEFVLFPDTDDSYDMDFITYIAKARNGDEYDANIILNDTVDGESSQWVSAYSEGFLYYEYEGGLYKEEFENWDEVRKAYDGYYFDLVDYTVNNVHVTNYKDGYKKIEFGFNLQNLAEAPDEFIFEILSTTASTYKNLSFNDASFEGYISPEGYVTSYVMYYDGQVAPGDGTDQYTFKYRTTAVFSDINETTVSVPDNPEDYILVEVPEEETEEGYYGY